jgi:hypothetical protein
MTGATAGRKKRQSGQEILEFALMATFLVPMLLGTFVVGTSIIKNLQANQVVRDLDNIYIHGGDFSTYSMQQLAQRLGQGLNIQFPAFGSGVNNSQSNTGSSGDGLIWVSQVMYSHHGSQLRRGRRFQLHKPRQLRFYPTDRLREL